MSFRGHYPSEKTVHRWEKYLQVIYVVRDLNLEYMKNSFSLIIKRQPNVNMGKESEQTVFQRYTMANKCRRRCSTPLTVREMQMKTTLSYHFTPTRTTRIKTTRAFPFGCLGGAGPGRA